MVKNGQDRSRSECLGVLYQFRGATTPKTPRKGPCKEKIGQAKKANNIIEKIKAAERVASME